jgi:DNA-binding NtrC family response regulator
MIERALALSDGAELTEADFPIDGAGAGVAPSTSTRLAQAAEQRLSLHELEDRYIEEVMELVGGNKVQAAKILGIDRKTLYRRRNRGAMKEAAREQA